MGFNILRVSLAGSKRREEYDRPDDAMNFGLRGIMFHTRELSFTRRDYLVNIVNCV